MNLKSAKRKEKQHNAYLAGYDAFMAGKDIASCPYTVKSWLGVSWRAGWYRAQSKKG